MKKTVLVIIAFLTIGVCTAQNVTNVAFRQVNKKVEVTYTLDKTANISLSVSTDGGKTFSAPLKHVTGDVGNNVSAGNNKTIIWDALEDVDKIVGSQIVFKVTAEPKIGKQTFRVNGVSFTMVYVQGGTFTMGATSEQGSDAYSDEKPTHSVTLSSFSIGETEVTQALWQAVMGSVPTYSGGWETQYGKGSNYPAYRVSWNDCQTFINKLNSLTGKNFRLPTEAEWEFAARGGNKSRGYKYSGSNSIGDVAWYDGNSNSQTHPVKQKQANELGIYDMSGNVLEWCQDVLCRYKNVDAENPCGKAKSEFRVNRGGSFCNSAARCRVSYRNASAYKNSSPILGLRLALDFPCAELETKEEAASAPEEKKEEKPGEQEEELQLEWFLW